MKPFIHAISSAKRFKGSPSDYQQIHDFMDSSKAAIADNRHRFLTHNSWFISNVIERIFGVTITNSDGKLVSTREIAEQHILEDFNGFIPVPTDYLTEIPYLPWMHGAGKPASSKNLDSHIKTNTLVWDKD